MKWGKRKGNGGLQPSKKAKTSTAWRAFIPNDSAFEMGKSGFGSGDSVLTPLWNLKMRISC
jgi:hypothetical protein